MDAKPSADIEFAARQALIAYIWDHESLVQLMSADPRLRVLGSDRDEWWVGPEAFLSVRQAQMREAGLSTAEESEFRIDHVEGFEEGEIGWASLFWTLVTPEAETQLRTTAVLRRESGAWRVVQWHNSIAYSNERVYGVDLTRTLDVLVKSVLDVDERLDVGSHEDGPLTLVFTDIVDSTHLAESMGDAEWADLISQHQATIRNATADHGGAVVKFLGDGSMLSFRSARNAVLTAADIQGESSAHPFSVRAGIHSGEVVLAGTDLVGLTVHKAARIASAANGGEIMISSTTRDLIGAMDEVIFGDPRTVRLKGIANTHQIVPISAT